MLIYILLPIAALLTSILSGMIGMGGGILLLATMFSVLSHAEAIPSHAAVQLVSNSTRTLALMRHVSWPTVARFSLGVIPGGIAGALIALTLGPPGASEPYLKMTVGVYILASLLLPVAKGRPQTGAWWEFPLLGVAAGAAAFTVGAVGPLIAPLFARRAFSKEGLVATKSVCQCLLHVAKIPVFLSLGSFDRLYALGLATGLMALLTIPGTLIGKGLLKRITPARFTMLFRVALLIAGLKVLCYDGLWMIVR